jgi:hypothetical protein
MEKENDAALPQVLEFVHRYDIKQYEKHSYFRQHNFSPNLLDDRQQREICQGCKNRR